MPTLIPQVPCLALPRLARRVICSQNSLFHLLHAQIHLYSDGGLDISADGRYIFTCAMVAAKPVLALPAAARRTPPLPLLSSLLLSSSSRRSKWRSGGSPCSSNSSDSCFTAESENDKDGEGEGEVMSERDGEHMQGIGAALGSLVLGDRTQAVNPGRLVSIPGTHGLGDVCTTALQLNPLPRDMVHAAPEVTTLLTILFVCLFFNLLLVSLFGRECNALLLLL